LINGDQELLNMMYSNTKNTKVEIATTFKILRASFLSWISILLCFFDLAIIGIGFILLIRNGKFKGHSLDIA